MKLTIFSLNGAHHVTGMPAMGAMYLSIGDIIAVQWRAGDAAKHYEVQPDCETLHQVTLFNSAFANSFGEFADNVSYPATAKVTMPATTWASAQALLASLPGTVQSLDISLDGNGTFLDDGDEVDAAEYGEDCLQSQCYRFVRKSPTEWAFYLVLAAKHHDTYVRYGLVQEGV